MASRAISAREIPGIVVLTMEALVKCGVSMVSIALAYASQALTKTLQGQSQEALDRHQRNCDGE
jgi:hypothetical protein